MPCYKITIRFDRDDMIKRFIASNTSGFYFSVIEGARWPPETPVEIVHRDPEQVSVADINHLYYGTSHSSELLQRTVNVEALPASWRDYLRERADRREHMEIECFAVQCTIKSIGPPVTIARYGSPLGSPWAHRASRQPSVRSIWNPVCRWFAKRSRSSIVN